MIDASIPMSGRPYVTPDPLETMGKMLTLRQLQQMGQFRSEQTRGMQLENDESVAAAGRREKVRQILSGQPDLDKALPQIYGVDPASGMTIEKHMGDRRNANLDTLIKQTTAEIQRIEMVGRIFGSAKDQPTYERALMMGSQMRVFPPEMLAQFPAQYDAAAIEQIANLSLNRAQQLAEQRAQLEQTYKTNQEARAASEEKRKVSQEERAVVSDKRDAAKDDEELLGKQIGNASQTVSLNSQQAHWDIWRNSLPENIKRLIPGQYSEENVALVQRMGMTAQQRSAEDDRAEVRDEANRHNIATEQGATAGRAEERRKNIAAENGAGTKALSGDASKTYSISSTLLQELGVLKQKFTENYKSTLTGFLSGADRQLVKLVERIADKVGRLRSGGAVNPEEERRFMRQLGSWPDLIFGDSKGAINAIDALMQEAKTVSDGIRPHVTSDITFGGEVSTGTGTGMFSHTVRLPDGKTQTFNFKSKEALDAFLTDIGGR